MKNSVKILIVVAVLVVLALPLAFVAWSAVSAIGRQTAILPLQVAASLRPVTTGALVRLPGVGVLQGPDGDRLVMGGAFELKEGETLDGSLVVMGGIATLQAGSEVRRDVIILGGTLRASGEIGGNIVAVGGTVELNETALVEGDVNIVSGNLARAEGARIEGRINDAVSGPFAPVIIPSTQVWTPVWNPGAGLLWLSKGLILLFRSCLWAILALLVVLLWPKPAERVRQTIVANPVIAGGLGLLTAVVAPLLLVVITITIIGIPISLVGLFLFVVAWAFGVIIVSLEVGQRLVVAAKQEWAPAVAAGLGAFIVTLVGNLIGVLVPCVGWMVPALVGMLGLGAVLLTRFGTQDYQPYPPLRPVEAPAAVTPPAPEPPGDEPQV